MRRLILTIILPLMIFNGLGQNNNLRLISGKILDENATFLIGASVYTVDKLHGTATNNLGDFYLKVPSNYEFIEVSYLSYQTQKIQLDPKKTEQNLTIQLIPQTIKDKGVIISSEKEIENTPTGMETIQLEMIKNTPALLGEPDLIQTIKSTAGVQASSEGSSGFYVRGGQSDQNLVSYDGAVVYNPSHVLGVFSVFNYNALKKADLLKGYIPSKYGGRLSSVLDIQSNTGNFNKWSSEIGLGTVLMNIHLDGPVIKDRLSISFSGRRSFIEEIVKPAYNATTKNKNDFFNRTEYGFYDYNLKVSSNLSDKHKLSYSWMRGSDDYKLEPESNFSNKLNWLNDVHAINWTYIPGDKSVLKTVLVSSNYFFEFNANIQANTIDLRSSVGNRGLKSEYQLYLKNTMLVFGVQANNYQFSPNNISVIVNQETFSFNDRTKLQAYDVSSFLSIDHNINDKWSIYGGLRSTAYFHLGPYQITKSQQDNILDTINYDKGELIQYYQSFEPRLSAKYSLNEKSSLKAHLTRNVQFLHMASPSSVALPSDIWIPSTQNILPQKSWQYGLGYYYSFNEAWQFSSEAYWKNMQNQIEVLYGISSEIQQVNDLDKYAFGTGRAYGLELQIKKKSGIIHGSVNYTISKTQRKFNELNDGLWYNAAQDRPHEVNVVGNISLNKSLTISSSFIYASGQNMTVPIRKYILGGNLINQYSSPNAYRIPAYHRLDVSLNYKFKVSGKYESMLDITVINIYNRENPFYIYYEITGSIEDNSLDVNAKKVSLLPVLPSFKWILKF